MLTTLRYGFPATRSATISAYFVSDPGNAYAGDQTYTPLTSAVRALDTDTSSGLTGTNLSTANGNLTSTGSVAANSAFNLKIAGANGVLATATAVAVNLTTTAASGAGYLEAYPTGAVPASLTSLTYGTAAVASLAADVPIGTGGQITIYNHGNITDVIADITGYYTPATGGTGEMYHAVNPTRLVDTRNGTGISTGKAAAIGSNHTYTISQADTQQITTAANPTLATMLTTADSTAGGYFVAHPTRSGTVHREPRPRPGLLGPTPGPA